MKKLDVICGRYPERHSDFPGVGHEGRQAFLFDFCGHAEGSPYIKDSLRLSLI